VPREFSEPVTITVKQEKETDGCACDTTSVAALERQAKCQACQDKRNQHDAQAQHLSSRMKRSERLHELDHVGRLPRCAVACIPADVAIAGTAAPLGWARRLTSPHDVLRQRDELGTEHDHERQLFASWSNLGHCRRDPSR
jgi:hypothetical protein